MRARLVLPLLLALGACAARTAPPPDPAPAVVAVQPPPAVAAPSPAPLARVPAPAPVAVRPAPPVAPASPAPAMRPVEDVPQDRVQALSWNDLDGWSDGDHTPVVAAMREACEKIADAPADSGIGGQDVGGRPLFGTGIDWSAPCREARTARDATAFFEKWFVPVALGGAEDGTALFTAYYEPELDGARVRGGPYVHPLYARPDDLQKGVPYLDRAAIDAGALEGRGLELFWLDDPVESFFLHIQGSGRVRLPDGSIARVGYAGKNNRSYKAIGRTLVDWGELDLDGVSKESIEAWIAANPHRRDELFATNPSYVFFTEREELNADPTLGPVGSLGLPLPSQRAIAVDRRFYALGIPMWVDFDSPVGPVRRLTLALDTGGAIKGARRADYFFGSGDAAGLAAGATRTRGRLIALTPRTAFERIFGPIA